MINYKGYIISPDKAFPNSYKVATEGRGGKIPDVLDSLFTSVGFAKQEIDLYLESKELSSGKKRTTGGD